MKSIDSGARPPASLYCLSRGL